MSEKKPDTNRGYIAFVVVILLGYILGIFLKKVTLGLIIGLALGLLGTSFLKRR
ncbi:MAG: hypothetical protein M3Y85_11060 [Bacteroidota bacterium]|nr:hypothetical protein [Bacteroidota bacterium]